MVNTLTTTAMNALMNTLMSINTYKNVRIWRIKTKGEYTHECTHECFLILDLNRFHKYNDLQLNCL